MKIDTKSMMYKELNELIAQSPEKEFELLNVNGQRYIGAGLSGRKIMIDGTPGNALAAYMNDCAVTVKGSAQDATGDTMNHGSVIIHGRCGDACGYAMRGGEIIIRDDTGYRTGIHMKEYKEQRPLIIVGGKTGDFLGEYLAGGVIAVFGIGTRGIPVGRFCGTGMHGGVIYLRSDEAPYDLPKQVNVEPISDEDLFRLRGYAEKYCGCFGGSPDELMSRKFIKLTPNSKNPYRQLYTNNW
ncbi:MAG: glutamate synthase [Clostridia bacterium]|nr:glutamate synthase [Clostridia bacterium]MDR3645109.1 glutamate synthase [Clostridia bacterium]